MRSQNRIERIVLEVVVELHYNGEPDKKTRDEAIRDAKKYILSSSVLASTSITPIKASLAGSNIVSNKHGIVRRTDNGDACLICKYNDTERNVIPCKGCDKLLHDNEYYI